MARTDNNTSQPKCRCGKYAEVDFIGQHIYRVRCDCRPVGFQAISVDRLES